MKNIYVNCVGNLKKEIMDFFEECIYGSEVSKRERYTNIYFETKLHLNNKLEDIINFYKNLNNCYGEV